MSVVILGVSLAIALFSAAVAAFTLRALWGFARRGASVAQQAYEQGESVSSWWNAAPVCNTPDHPRDGERFAMGGRTDPVTGDEFTEERAVYAR